MNRGMSTSSKLFISWPQKVVPPRLIERVDGAVFAAAPCAEGLERVVGVVLAVVPAGIRCPCAMRSHTGWCRTVRRACGTGSARIP